MRAPVLVVWVVACVDGGDTGDGTGTQDTFDGDADTDADSDSDTDVPPDPVTVGFTGEVVTVAGTPFGFDDTVRTTPISGSFTYDRSVGDDDGNDPMRGTYDHEGRTAPFDLHVGGKAITGSGQPVVTIELFSHTFRWVDGPQILDDTPFRACAVDGVTDPEIQLHLSVTPDSGEPFADDSLPAAFPFVGVDLAADTAITFTVEDAGGTLLFQLDAFTSD